MKVNIKKGKDGMELKEYYNSAFNLKFEGHLINGEKTGKGKEYTYHGKVKFEGEYLNGERNGFGREYDEDGYLIFEGEYLEGKRKI